MTEDQDISQKLEERAVSYEQNGPSAYHTATLLREARAAIELLRSLIRELADDLEAELKGHYGNTLDHPSERRRFERDMDSVYRARAALEPISYAALEPKP